MNSKYPSDTQDQIYTEQLIKKQKAWWKRLLDVQAPYRWNLRRLKLGFTLDIGCGIGRNLIHIKGNGVGIDHNSQSVEICRKQGLKAFTPKEFQVSRFNKPKIFDSILLAHVAEHMKQQQAITLLETYLPLLKSNAKVIIICPQEAGYKSDSTHIEFIDFRKLHNINNQLGLTVQLEYSFPFPRFFGRYFTYNEFITVSLNSEKS